jgi:L-asparagine transporter-like permease
MMAIAALLATASSVNANLFAAGNITALLARERLFPPLFGGRALGGPRGLVISAAGVLVLANVFDLTAIAQIGSVVAMVIFLMLGVAALRLRRLTHSNSAVIVATMAMTTVVLVLFVLDALENDPATVVSTVVITLLAVLLERVWARARERAAAERAPALR